MKHSARFFLTFCISLVFFLLFHPPLAQAMEFRTSEQTVTVRSDEQIQGSLFAAGDTVEINGSVNGDVYCAGKAIIVKGSVTGDVLCAGQTIEIDGAVSGSIRSVGQTVMLNGYIGRNVNVAGQTVTIGNTSVVTGDVVSAGQMITLGGIVRQGLAAAGDTVLVNGMIGGDTNFVVSKLQLGETAKVSGTLTYESDKDAVIATGASVGKVVKQPMRKNVNGWNNPQKKVPEMIGVMQKPWPMSAVGSIVTFFLLSVVLILLFPGKTERVVDMIGAHAGRSVIIGFLSCVVTPILFVTLILTVIGIPLALLLVLFFVLMLFVSKVFVALWVGKMIYSSFMKTKNENWYAIAALGVTVSYLVFHLPFIGWLVSGVAVLIGMGGMVNMMFSRQVKKNRRT